MCNTKLLLAAWETWTVKNQGLRGFQHPSPRSRCRLLWGPRVCHWEPSQRWWSNFPRRRACDHGKGRQMPEAMARATGETATLCGGVWPQRVLGTGLWGLLGFRAAWKMEDWDPGCLPATAGLQCSYGALYWQSLSLCQLVEEKCLQGPSSSPFSKLWKEGSVWS